jgi:nucleotide-binding universal stress UspA family protein
MSTRAIVVGTDGTTSSKAAVDWAAREAQRRRLRLHIVHAFDWDWHDPQYDIGHEYIDINRKLAEAVVAAAIDQARTVAPAVDVDGDTLIGHAAPRLLDVAQHTELLVLGSRGRGGFGSLLLGSVSQRVATHAGCPVVVVRGRGDVDEGPVAAGVDDSPTADIVLAAAFDAAADRGCALTVVRAYLPVIPLWLADVSAADVDTKAQDIAERTELDRQLAPWRDKYPQVPVETVMTHGSPASALVHLSARAQLVIVGSRGRGVVAGALLGSTGLQLLHHADCPVHIVRQASETGEQS